jgi:hypothetical protein
VVCISVFDPSIRRLLFGAVMVPDLLRGATRSTSNVTSPSFVFTADLLTIAIRQGERPRCSAVSWKVCGAVLGFWP